MTRVAFVLVVLVGALTLWADGPPAEKPLNWEAGIGVVVDVRFATYKDGTRYVSLVYADGRTVEVSDRLLYGPQPAPDFLSGCDQIYSVNEVKEAQ